MCNQVICHKQDFRASRLFSVLGSLFTFPYLIALARAVWFMLATVLIIASVSSF